ncbi:YerC/YecD family TrpR-related protein [uncultured Acetobacterium sp.]|jgi:TrpR-related protein YerC/YecD|uniref:YerC/YecD family TrpR-related protein n=1 Tax=uncultured Acetobacterium sp. TaxID=217139 RepID=UPI0024285445|nr:YerC/YecD family TrpR-related protein [uncultured Acetobacterium sp.]MBU4541908.1 DNA-binding transcriptional regulator [Bacillota bacterium]MDP2844009.1 YerC/YecD family TrpR-related protein [Acetobacterium sp.]
MEANTKRKVLAQAILALENEADCNLLLEDLCTIKEIEDMAHRFEIAYLLSQGKTFIDVEKLTGASSATISRVNRCLKHGKGYRNIIEKMKKDHTLE